MSSVGQIDRTVFSRRETASAAPGSRERDLVELARGGDLNAFAALVDGRLPSTFRIVMAILGNESDARDTTQTILVRAWSGLPGLTDPDRFAAWFGRILVNTCRTSIRTRRRQLVREIPMSGLMDGGASLASGSGDHEADTASADRLERAIERLTIEERTILALHHVNGLSLAELGEYLGLPSKTVKSRLFTARRALERSLSREDR